MMAYIIDTQKFEVVRIYPDASCASLDMPNNYSREPSNYYKMFHDEDALFDYWNLAMEESGVFHEGLGYSENARVDMFNDWVKN